MILGITAALKRSIVRVFSFPYAKYLWRTAEHSRSKERWDDAISALERLHRLSWENDNSHFMLAVALTETHRFEEAVVEFEKIGGPLDLILNQQARVLNHALALSASGRPAEAIALLPAREKFAEEFSHFPDTSLQLHDRICEDRDRIDS